MQLVWRMAEGCQRHRGAGAAGRRITADGDQLRRPRLYGVERFSAGESTTAAHSARQRVGNLARDAGLDSLRPRCRHGFPCSIKTIGEGAKKYDDVGDILGRHCRRFAGVAVERRLVVDVALELLRQIVEFADLAIRPNRIPSLGVGIARGIERDGVFQRVEYAIVIKRFTYRHIAQARRLEQATEFGAVCQILPLRSAGAEIKVIRVSVGGNLLVAWYPDGDETGVREHRESSDRRQLALVTMNAVAPRRVIESIQAAEFLGCELGPPAQERVILAGERAEFFGSLLVGFQGLANRGERAVRLRKDGVAINLPHL